VGDGANRVTGGSVKRVEAATRFGRSIRVL
jgi:hypothetical protein